MSRTLKNQVVDQAVSFPLHQLYFALHKPQLPAKLPNKRHKTRNIKLLHRYRR